VARPYERQQSSAQSSSEERIDDVAEVLQRGSSLVGGVIGVMKAQFRVEISLRESDVGRGEACWFAYRNTPSAMKEWRTQCRLSPEAKESHFQEEEALRQYTATYI